MKIPGFGRRLPRPTRAGLATIVAAAGCVVAAWLLGSIELAGAGAVIAVLVIVGFARVAITPHVTVQRQLNQSRVARGRPLSAHLRVMAVGGPLVPLGVVDDPVGERGLARVKLGRRGETSVSYPLPTARRGPVRVGPATVTVTDAFGVWRRRDPGPAATDLLVLPGIVALDPPPAWTRRQGRAEGQRADPLGGPGEEFHAVRPWEDGDDVRHVHWPSVARTGELMVRQHEPAGTGHLTLELDTLELDTRLRCRAEHREARPGRSAEGVFEQMVTLVASLLVATTRAGDTVDLIVGADPVRTVSTGPSLDRALDHLAVLDPVSPGVAPPEVEPPGRRIRITGPLVGETTGAAGGNGAGPVLTITVDPDAVPGAWRPSGPTLVVALHPDDDPAAAWAAVTSRSPTRVAPRRVASTP